MQGCWLCAVLELRTHAKTHAPAASVSANGSHGRCYLLLLHPQHVSLLLPFNYHVSHTTSSHMSFPSLFLFLPPESTQSNCQHRTQNRRHLPYLAYNDWKPSPETSSHESHPSILVASHRRCATSGLFFKVSSDLIHVVLDFSRCCYPAKTLWSSRLDNNANSAPFRHHRHSSSRSHSP